MHVFRLRSTATNFLYTHWSAWSIVRENSHFAIQIDVFAIETQYTATNLLIKVLQTLRVLGVPTHTLTEYYAGCFPSFLQPGNEATLV